MKYTVFKKDDPERPRVPIGHFEFDGVSVTEGTGPLRGMKGWLKDSVSEWIKKSGWVAENGHKLW